MRNGAVVGECRLTKSLKSYVINVHRHGLHIMVLMEENSLVRTAIAFSFLLRANVGIRLCTTKATAANTGRVLSTLSTATTRVASTSAMAKWSRATTISSTGLRFALSQNSSASHEQS